MEITKIFLLLPPRLGIFLTPLREETLQNVKIFVFRKKEQDRNLNLKVIFITKAYLVG